MPTTAPLNATGPEDPEGGIYGLIQPRQFTLAVVPLSFDFATADARWRGWGLPVATATGSAEFNVIMSPLQRVSYSLAVSHRRLIKCATNRDHYSYGEVAVHIARYEGGAVNFSERMHTGCSILRTPLL